MEHYQPLEWNSDAELNQSNWLAMFSIDNNELYAYIQGNLQTDIFQDSYLDVPLAVADIPQHKPHSQSADSNNLALPNTLGVEPNPPITAPSPPISHLIRRRIQHKGQKQKARRQRTRERKENMKNQLEEASRRGQAMRAAIYDVLGKLPGIALSVEQHLGLKEQFLEEEIMGLSKVLMGALS